MKTKTGRMRRAYTLMEVMVATSVGVLMMLVVMMVLYTLGRMYTSADIKNTVSEDYRELTRLLAEQGNLSNGFYIYRSFDSADRNGGNNTDGIPDQIGTGNSGDFVVFIYYSMQDIKTSPNMQRVSRIVGFYRTQTSDPAVSQIRWFDSAKHNWGQTFSATNPATLAIDGTGVEALLPSPKSNSAADLATYNSAVSNFPVLAFQTMGTAADDSAGQKLRLFYNNNAKSFSVSGMIIRKQTGSGTTAVNYKSQSAFNLTIAPRSATN